eukprot:GHVS01038352.1.p1 GENE.GHVS01038352.1~~GHVS01038352.1.p1  ORF type:complete len:515 (+),score=85.64 GHVS01038352.1:127-1671(+)
MGCGCSRDSSKGEDIRTYYKIDSLLGSGAFGQVRECIQRQTGEVRAVKIMEKRSAEKGHWSNESMCRREVALLQRIDHPHIVRHYDFFEDRHFLYSVMQKCEGGELFEQILRRKFFNEEAASILCSHMLEALQYVHDLGIVHRDIKAENFLFMVSPGQKLTEVCGSPHYLSPELIRRSYRMEADMWAFGVLVYLMLYGRYPFDGPNTGHIVKEILGKPIDWTSSHVNVSSLAIDFMKKLLCRDATIRLTASSAVGHAWVRVTSEEKERTEIPMDILRSAHRKVTMQKAVPQEGVERRRNELLRKLDSDFRKGFGTGGVHLSSLSTPQKRPEFSRHDKRVCTTPSRMQDMAGLEAIRRSQLSLLSSDASATDPTARIATPAPDPSSSSFSPPPTTHDLPTVHVRPPSDDSFHLRTHPSSSSAVATGTGERGRCCLAGGASDVRAQSVGADNSNREALKKRQEMYLRSDRRAYTVNIASTDHLSATVSPEQEERRRDLFLLLHHHPAEGEGGGDRV